MALDVTTIKPSDSNNILVQIDEGTEGTPNFVTVAGQKGAKVTCSYSALDVACKDRGAVKSVIAGAQDWGVELDGLVFPSADGYYKLFNTAKNKGLIKLKIYDTVNHWFLSGTATITETSMDASFDSACTYSVKIAPYSELTITQETV
jgi:predicted secreted protein